MKRSIAESELSGSGRRVYFLGAGASKSILPTLPLASELTLHSLADPNSYSNDIPPVGKFGECGSLQQFLDSLPATSDLRHRPLEYSLTRLKSEDHEYYDLVLYCLAMRLSTWSCACEALVDLEPWLRTVRERRDVIITTNYDTLIERALSVMGTGEWRPRDFPDRDALHWLDFGVGRQKLHAFSYENNWPTAPERSILLLKLHGSISWLFCETCKTYLLDPIWQNAQDARARPGAYDPCPACKMKTSRRWIVVPPLIDKQYTEPAILEIWEKAKEALCGTQEIIFAGFSLCSADQSVRRLLSEAFSFGQTQKVTVIDRDPAAVEGNYRQIYGDVMCFASETDWKGYLRTVRGRGCR